MRFLLLTFTLLHSHSLAASANALLPLAPLRINLPDFPPYFFKDGPNVKRGIASDILGQCMNQLKRPYVYVELPIERTQISMQNGSIDINAYSYKKDRESFLSFGRQEIFHTEYRPFVRVDSPIKIQKINDFDSLTLGHLIGLRYSPEFFQYVEGRRKARQLDLSSDTEQNLRKLVTGRIDTFVNAVEPTLYAAHQLGLAERIKTLNWMPHDAHYFIAVSKNSQRIHNPDEFLVQLDSCLSQMKADGTFCATYANYGLACPKLPNRP